MPVGPFLLIGCAAVYGVMAIFLVFRHRRPAPLLLAAGCAVTAGWAALSAFVPAIPPGIDGPGDLVRALAWFGFVFALYRMARTGRPAHEIGFALAALTAATLGGVGFLSADADGLDARSMFSVVIASRLGLAIAELLLIENLYLNLPESSRWHIALPCVLLGGLAAFDILLCADLVLAHQPTPALVAARTLGMIMIAPLLAIAASRGRRWSAKLRLSRTAAFHSATLMLTGGVLVALGLSGEVLRNVDSDWKGLLQFSLGFAALIGMGVTLTSGAARSRVQRMFIDHFFAERYDYRRQWLSCIQTLSGDENDIQSGLPTRAIRCIVSVVDSPAGALFLREGGAGPFAWAGSWNLPATDALPADHPVIAATRGGSWIPRLDFETAAAFGVPPLDKTGPLWLAVPLLDHGAMIGVVLCAPPRAPFILEQEVFDLLRIVAQEVSSYITEQRATQTLLQTRDLHDYSKRFAFVAHDIKNVSSQLALLLSNAEYHIANPEFQKDMLETVRSSVHKITALLQRLEQPVADRAPAALAPLPRLEALAATYRRVRRVQITLDHDGSTGAAAMGGEAFDTVVTHLLNNAVEAAPESPVQLRIRHESTQILIDIIDRGPGMTAEFVRDHLFQPFTTSKPGGSGIGAYQARDLLRQAGGDLLVITEPGAGTTMRMKLPRTDTLTTPGAVPTALLEA